MTTRHRTAATIPVVFGLLLVGCEQEPQQPPPPAGQQTPMPFPNVPQPPAQPQGQQPQEQSPYQSSDPAATIRDLLICWKTYQQLGKVNELLAENEQGEKAQRFARAAEEWHRISNVYARMVLSQQQERGFTDEQVANVAKQVESNSNGVRDRAEGVEAYLNYLVPITEVCHEEYPVR